MLPSPVVLLLAGFLAQVVDAAAPALVSASSARRSVDGEVLLAGLDAWAIHTHGGAAANLSGARFRVTDHGRRPRQLAVRTVRFLYGSCRTPLAPAPRQPVVEGLDLPADGGVVHVDRLQLRPGTVHEVIVRFSPVEAYQGWCERFVFEVDFLVDGALLTVRSETMVEREEP